MLKMKKTIAILLSIALLFSLSISAVATESYADEIETVQSEVAYIAEYDAAEAIDYIAVEMAPLGANPVATCWGTLQEAVDAAPANVPVTIEILNSFRVSMWCYEIIIPADRNITLVSTSSIHIQHSRRHFLVYGSLTLERIQLFGDSWSGLGGGVIVFESGTLTMNEGSAIMHGGCLEGPGGVDVYGGVLQVNGGAIGGNRGYRGGGVRIRSGGHMHMIDGYISDNKADWAGGGIYLSDSSAAHILGGNIQYNTASYGGGIFVYNYSVVHIAGTAISGNTAGNGGGVFVGPEAIFIPFIMEHGSITNNVASSDGGGIFSSQASQCLTVASSAYMDLNIGEDVIFYGNTAGEGASAPPNNRLPHIRATSASIWDYVLNNYDINYTGRLGQTPDGGNTPSDINLALNTQGAVMSASSAQGVRTADRANNGVREGAVTNSWSAAGVDQEWLMVDFGKQRNFNTVRNFQGGSRIMDYRFEHSNDGVNWTVFHSSPNRMLPATPAFYEVTTPATTQARFIRLVSERSSGAAIAVFEFEVYYMP